MEGRPEGEDGEGKKERKAFFLGLGKYYRGCKCKANKETPSSSQLGRTSKGVNRSLVEAGVKEECLPKGRVGTRK